MSERQPEIKNIIEAALLASETPLGVKKLLSLFPRDAAPSREEIKSALGELDADYAHRGIELKRVGNAYRFQSREKYASWLRKLNEGRPPRYSRALLETLAIIAYRQPVTRGDIEDVRGVTVSSETMRTLLNRQWVKQVGQRDVPGRPALFGTTQSFLEYFNLRSLSELPALMERREPAEIAGELNLELPLESPADSAPPADAAGEDPGPDVDQEPRSAEIIHLDAVAHDGDGGRETT